MKQVAQDDADAGCTVNKRARAHSSRPSTARSRQGEERTGLR